MFNFDYITNEDIKKYSQIWQDLPDHPYHILIIGSSESRKTNALLNLINNESNIDKIYYKDPYKAKYQLLVKKRESKGLRYLNNSKALIEYLNDMDDIYK